MSEKCVRSGARRPGGLCSSGLRGVRPRPQRRGLPVYDFAVCGEGTCAPHAGFTMLCRTALSGWPRPTWSRVPPDRRAATTTREAARRAARGVARGARILSLCTGAFVLGEAGLLGRPLAAPPTGGTPTGWPERFPRRTGQPDVLYVDDDGVLTSAGTAAGIDACLHLWRQEFGAAAAGAIARRMVVPPQREGGQAQFIDPGPGLRRRDARAAARWLLTDAARAHGGDPRPPGAACPRAPSPAGSAPRPAPRRTPGSPASGCCSPSACWRAPTSRSTHRRPLGFGNAATLRHHFPAGWAPPPRPTAGPSPAARWAGLRTANLIGDRRPQASSRGWPGWSSPSTCPSKRPPTLANSRATCSPTPAARLDELQRLRSISTVSGRHHQHRVPVLHPYRSSRQRAHPRADIAATQHLARRPVVETVPSSAPAGPPPAGDTRPRRRRMSASPGRRARGRAAAHVYDGELRQRAPRTAAAAATRVRRPRRPARGRTEMHQTARPAVQRGTTRCRHRARPGAGRAWR